MNLEKEQTSMGGSQKVRLHLEGTDQNYSYITLKGWMESVLLSNLIAHFYQEPCIKSKYIQGAGNQCLAKSKRRHTHIGKG